MATSSDVQGGDTVVPLTVAPVFRLIYRSRSRIPAGAEKEELGRILRISRLNNGAQGVTGALLYYDNWFSQALEGPEDKVRAVYDRIKADKRHSDLQINSQGVCAARVFPRWSMANVGEHGSPDMPLTATAEGVSEAAAWKITPGQEEVLLILREITRGYGIGA